MRGMPTSPRGPVLAAIALAAAACGRNPPEPAVGEASAPAVSSVPASASSTAPSASTAASSGPPDGGFDLGDLPPDAPFEGILEMVINRSSENGDLRLVLALKGKKVRWDLYGSGGTGRATGFRVYDGETRQFTTVMPAEKVVMTTDESALTGDASAPRAYKLSPLPFEPKGAVGGIACERDRTQDDQNVYELCAAPGLVPFPLHLLSSVAATVVPFNPMLQAKGLFPLAVTVHQGQVSTRTPIAALPVLATLQVLRVRRGRVPGSAFDIPAYESRIKTTALQFGPSAR
jgi:hypothetical protein